MIDQHTLDLFEPPPRARKSDPTTSHASARNVERFFASHAGRILIALQDRGPSTVDELSATCGLQSQQINKRLPELERIRLARPTDKTRPSKSGMQERIWEATP